MRIVSQSQTPQYIRLVLLLLLLACGPVDRLQELNRKGRVLATGVATISEGDYSAFEAYEKLHRLPGYRLESRNTIRDPIGNISSFIISSSRDTQGNRHTITVTPDGQQTELYIIDGRTYIYDAGYEGWVDPTTLADAEKGSQDTIYRFEASQFSLPLQLLSQFGAVPTEAKQETYQGRSVTRYELDYVIGQLTETFAEEGMTYSELEGAIWIDDETEALLRAEIVFYEPDAQHPNQEFVLEISQIGDIAPIDLPTPPVNPETAVSATATAEAWSTLAAKISYEGEPIEFELVPVQIYQTIDAPPIPKAQMKLLLRQLPARLLVEPDTAKFLTQLEQQLALSIPKKNLVVTGSGFRANKVDQDNQSIEVVYFFETNLEDFDHIELVLSGSGNPIFAPVPVAR